MKFVIRAIISTLLYSEIGAQGVLRGTSPGDNSDAENMSLQGRVEDLTRQVAELKDAGVGLVSSVEILDSGKWELTKDGSNPLGICQGDCNKDADCALDLKCFQRDYITSKDPPDCHGLAILQNDYCSRYSAASMVEVTSSAAESAASASIKAPQELTEDISDTENVSLQGKVEDLESTVATLQSTGATLNKDIQILHTGLWTFNTFNFDHLYQKYLGICEGDCKNDDECVGNLKCFQRPSRSSPNPPDCTGDPVLRCNYCSKYQNSAEISDEENVSLQGGSEDLVVHTEDISDAENVSLQGVIEDLVADVDALDRSASDLAESIDILNTGKWMLNSDKPVGSKMGICQGNCDGDDDCAFDLKCFVRPKRYDPIPPECIGDPVKYCGYCSRVSADSTVLEVASE